MSFIGKFHPVLVHFPIALVLAAAAAELGSRVPSTVVGDMKAALPP
jgi:uncharacterized membrane protein